MKKHPSKYLLFIIIIGLILRFVGITHSFPYIFHPDEPTIVRSALGIRFNPNPGHFDWPHLYVYLNYLLFMVFAKVRDFLTEFGYKEQVSFYAPIIWNDDLIFYLLTRSFTAILGALTAIPVYLAAKEVFNTRVGLLSALAISVVPFHVWHSHYSLTDVPMTFFLAWAIYFSTKIMFYPDTKNYVWAGLFTGLAASTKYNGGLIAVMVLIAHIFRVLSEPEEKLYKSSGMMKLFYSGLAAISGFVVGTPYSVLDFDTFIRTDGPKGALWQFTNVGSTSFFEHINQFTNAFTIKLLDDFGYTLLILFVFLVAYLVVRLGTKFEFLAQKSYWFFVLPAILLIYYISGFESPRSHYYFIAYPLVIISTIGFFNTILSSFKFSEGLKVLMWMLVLLIPFTLAIFNSLTFFREDTRLLMNTWLMRGNKQVFYDDNDLEVALKGTNLPVKKIDITKSSPAQNSYLIISDDDMSRLDKDANKLNSYTKYKKIQFISNNLRNGPNILIYEVY